MTHSYTGNSVQDPEIEKLLFPSTILTSNDDQNFVHSAQQIWADLQKAALKSGHPDINRSSSGKLYAQQLRGVLCDLLINLVFKLWKRIDNQGVRNDCTSIIDFLPQFQKEKNQLSIIHASPLMPNKL